MFWRFGGYANISTLDQVLDKPDVTLEELLDESDLIQEVKAQNAKLIDFLRDEGRLEKLLEIVIAAPTPADTAATPSTAAEEQRKQAGGFFGRSKGRSKSRDVESEHEKAERQRMKHAYVACEILSSEVYSIYETLLENPAALRQFWGYIQQDAPLDPTQASYFTKVNEALLEKKTEDMTNFIKSLDDVVRHMMKHVDCPMVMDLLLKLISLEKDPEGQGIVDWLQQQRLIPMLLDCISPENSAATQTSAGDFLKAIITISANATGQDASVIGPNELTRQLVSEPCVNRLCKEMLRGGNPLTVGVGIVIEVIRKNNSDYDSEGQTGPEPKSTDPIYLGSLLRIFSHHVADFMTLILSKQHSTITDDGVKIVDRHDLKVAWGDSIEPLGFDRFKTCELMAELLHCSNMGLLNEKGKEALIKSRDLERERLKAEGRLFAAPIAVQGSQADFGQSVDSSGFHHPEDYPPLGESPEDIRRLEVQNQDDEDFEKVAIPEIEGDSGTDVQGKQHTFHNDDDDELEDLTHLRMQKARLAGEQPSSKDPSSGSTSEDEHIITPTSSVSSKRSSVSLLTQQILAAEDQALNNMQGSTPGPHSADVPAPLFSKKPTQSATSAGEGATTTSDQSNPASNQQEGDQMSTFSQTDTLVEPSDQIRNQPEMPAAETEDDGSPVVGDLLKIKFVDNRVVPTILDFFFRFPWNNFLHNVVYDVVQQVFNGSMDRGFNRNLAVDLFERGRITTRIIEGQERSDKAQAERHMRLGYMGHLTLIAEEVVKFTERQPPEMLAAQVIDRIMDPDWIHYVEHTLTETRDRDNAILGGVRPDASVGPRQAVLNAVNAAQGFGNSGSNALANAGLGGNAGGGFDSLDLANAGNPQYGGGNLLSGFGSSDDEDDEEMEDAGDIGHPVEGELQQTADEYDPASDTPNAPSIPAPLAIPPSRARRQLAARLAEKKRNAASSSSDATDATSADSGTAATASSASGAAQPPGRFGGDATSSDETNPGGAQSALAGHSSEEDEEDDNEDVELGDAGDEDQEMRPAPLLKRQTTREAIERRPIDGDDDDDVDIERNQGARGVGGSGRGPGGGGGGQSARAAANKGREEDDDDDSSDEDKPVEMGLKSWMMRRSSSQGSLGK